MTWTVSAKPGVESKSSAASLATVTSPVLASIVKAPPALPPVIAYRSVSPASGSEAATVPTTVPIADISGTVPRLWSPTIGASLRLLRSIVMTAVSESPAPP